MAGRAKGSNMHHMRSFVLERWGHDGLARVLDSMAPGDASEIRALVPMTWHALALQHRFLRAIDTTHGSGDGELVTAIGRYEADKDLRVVHRLFLRMANPAYVLEKAGDYWSRFYDSGTWEVTRRSPNAAVGVLRECAPFDPFFAVYLHAYITRLFELVGAQAVSTHYDLDETQNPPVFTIDGTWR